MFIAIVLYVPFWPGRFIPGKFIPAQTEGTNTSSQTSAVNEDLEEVKV